MDNTQGKAVIAVDLGGTKIVAALVSPAGQVLRRERASTMAAEGPGPVMERVFALIESVLKAENLTSLDLEGISVAAAGPIDMANGLIVTPPNLPGWNSVPLKKLTADRYKVPSYLINDAKAAALGEQHFGTGRGVGNLIAITLGTGIGGGIIIGGKLYLGQSGAAGEIGHMTIDSNGPKCSCGNTGCWELSASGTGMEKEATVRISKGATSSLNVPFNAGGNRVTAREIEAAARQGDRMALDVMAWSSKNIGVGLANLINIFNPEMIVLGGGLSNIGDLLLKPAIDVARSRAFKLLSDAVRIVPSTVGEDTGMLGAAAFALKKGKV